MGIIDTLSAGFGTINRRPWLILVPVLLDLFLWLGPRLSADPVLAHAMEVYQGIAPSDGTAEQLAELVEQLKGANIFVMLAWQLPRASASPTMAQLGERAVLSIESDVLLLGMMLVLAAVGLVATCLYLDGIARTVRGESIELEAYLGRLWINFRRLAGYFLLLAGFLGLFGMPFAVVVVIVGLISPAAAGFLWFVGMVALIWLFLYLFFVSHAIFVGGRGPMQAVWDSVHLVARNFWSALWLIVLVNVILVGTNFIWMGVLEHPAGVLAAILGNAYIASGLAAAGMVFYRERVPAEKTAST